ncbi:MAG: hypothetical protein J3K34DRAFT_503517 [Monoraphidium minutum]|nr:MAG: hypothetical protein J3K34DRAFT_503517 [Monoraphidium minutum]
MAGAAPLAPAEPPPTPRAAARRRTALGPSSLAGQQAAVVAQIAAVAPLLALYFWHAPPRLAALWPALGECAPAALPVLLPRLLAASALPLLAAAVFVGNARFLGPGMNPLEEPMAASVLCRNLQNTLEQYVLHVAAAAGLAAWGCCAHAAALVPCFAAGRLLFLAGYLVHPAWRGAGFSATAVPTLGALAYCAWRLARDGPAAGLA